ncbi:hypothetical protein FOA52_004670 [Chlamydomonas sp. UWO 241]|nr:hypothetical protein FOA52_004670 [Chlamydomonas sp. UWO 241]
MQTQQGSSSALSPAAAGKQPPHGGPDAAISPFGCAAWLPLNCIVFFVKLADSLHRGWDLQAVVQVVYTSIFLAHWCVALASRRANNRGARRSKLAAALRWLFVDHVCAVLHITRNVLLVVLTTFNASISWSGPLDGMIVTTCYGALAAVTEAYDLTTSLVVNWAVLLPRSVIQLALLTRREELSLAMIVVLSLLHACTLAAIHIAVARCSAAALQLLQRRRAAVPTLWASHSDAPADHAAEASGRSAAGAVGGGGMPIYRSVVAGNASTVEFVTKFPSLHLLQHPQLSTPQGVAALQERLERRASEVLSRMRGERVEVRLEHLYLAAGCVVVAGRWHLQGVGGATEEEQRALVEEVLLEEMLQEVDPAPEGVRTPCSILDNDVLNSTSAMWQLADDDDDAQPEQATLHVETGQRTPVALPSMEGVPLLAVTTPLQALPLHNGGHSCVRMQFATPLLARALGRDPELVISFALAGGTDATAPLASLLRARICDLQVAARARGNPPGLIDVEIDRPGALAGAARESSGMLIAQLVDGPTMMAAVPVPLLPCTARLAVAELSRLGLDPRTASHVAHDLALVLLAPHPTGEPPRARRALMRHAALLLVQWAQSARLPATLALLGSAVAQMDAADASRPPPPRRPGVSPDATVVQGGDDGASPAADREAGGSASAANPAGSNAAAAAHSGPTTLWCKFNLLLTLVGVARIAYENRLGYVLLGSVIKCFLFTLPYIAILTARVFGHMQPGFCNLFRTGMDIPFIGILDLVEPLEVRSWWVRAAVAVATLVPPRVITICACSSPAGVPTLCTREAWGTFTSEVGLVAFLAPRVAMPFVANGAIRLCQWMSAPARTGRKSKHE